MSSGARTGGDADGNVRAVLFDYGKVLSLAQDWAAWVRIRTLTRMDEESLHQSYWAHRDAYDMGSLTGAQYWQTIADEGRFTMDTSLLRTLLAEDVELWGRLNAPMGAWARRLQKRGVRTGILSNLGDEMERGLRIKYPWLADFTHCTFSHAVRMIKPEPAIYQRAVAGLGCAASEVLFIDDREVNVQGAVAAGLQAVLYVSHEDFLRRMRAGGYGTLLDV
jgi:putative hydrolase of the HAD superfamily